MMRRLLSFLRICHFPALMLFGAAPLAVVLICLWDTSLLPIAGAYYAAGAVLAAACIAVPGRRRLHAAGLCVALLLATSAIFLPLLQRPALLLLPLAAGLLLFSALPLASRRLSELPPIFYAGGVLAYLFLHFTFLSNPLPEAASAAVTRMVTLLFVGYMSLFVLALNRISLDNATLARHAASSSMHTINTLLTLALLALALALSSIPALIRFVSAVWNTLRRAIQSVVLFLLHLLPASGDFGTQSPQVMQPAMQAPQQAEPGLFSIIMEYISTVLTILIVAIGTLVLLRLIAKGIVRLARYLSRRLKLFAANASEDYIDEISGTREDGAYRSRSERLRARRRTRAEADTPAARIRLRYARLLRGHPQWHSSSTARENLPDSPAALYERARYSDHPVTPEDAARFDQSVRRI